MRKAENYDVHGLVFFRIVPSEFNYRITVLTEYKQTYKNNGWNAFFLDGAGKNVLKN